MYMRTLVLAGSIIMALVTATTASAQQFPINPQLQGPLGNPVIRQPNRNPFPSETVIPSKYSRIPHNRITIVDGEFALDSIWERVDGKKLLVHTEGSLDKKVGLYSVTFHLANDSVSFAKTNRVATNLQKIGIPMLNQNNCDLGGYYAIKFTDFGFSIIDEKKKSEQALKATAAWAYESGIPQAVAIQKVKNLQGTVLGQDALEQNLHDTVDSSFLPNLIWENRPNELKGNPWPVTAKSGKNYDG